MIRFRLSGWWRTLVMAGALVLALPAYRYAAAANLAFDYPDDALALDPSNAVALRADANAIMQARPTKNDLLRVDNLVRQSLTTSVVNAPAFRIAGQVASSASDMGRAQSLMSTAIQLSRREAAAHLWFAGEFAKKGDLSNAIHRMDLALRVEPSLYETIFPAMVALAADRQGRPLLAGVVRDNPNWLYDFARFVASSPRSSVMAAPVLELTHGLPAGANFRSLESTIVKNLIAVHNYEAAVGLVSRLSSADPRALNDTHIPATARGVEYPPINWDFDSTDALDVSASPGDGGVAIDIGISGSDNQIIATKVLTLTPGTYAVTVPAMSGSGKDLVGAKWLFSCLSAGTSPDSATFVVPINKQLSDMMVIESGCTIQQLTLRLSSQNGQNLLDVRLQPPSLRRTDR